MREALNIIFRTNMQRNMRFACTCSYWNNPLCQCHTRGRILPAFRYYCSLTHPLRNLDIATVYIIAPICLRLKTLQFFSHSEHIWRISQLERWHQAHRLHGVIFLCNKITCFPFAALAKHTRKIGVNIILCMYAPGKLSAFTANNYYQ